MTTQAPALAVIAAGGVLGALARYGVESAWPAPPGAFPWAVFAINVSGCLLMGVLMAVVTEIRPHRPLLRPFLGVGLLGGYTTFSTYIVDSQGTGAAGAPLTALVYLFGTVLAALLAVTAGATLTEAVVRRSRS
jgi:CrcB protein